MVAWVPIVMAASSAVNAAMQERANRQNQENFNTQLQYNKDMLSEQNRYNLPTAQRQRYEDAGINPYLALSNISSGSQQSTLPAPGSPNINPVQFNGLSDAVNAYVQMQQQKVNEAVAQSQIAKTNEETKGLQVDNAHKEEVIQGNLTEQGARTENFKSSTAVNNKTVDKIMEEINGMKIDNMYKPAIGDMTLTESEARVAKLDAETAYIKTQDDIAKLHLDLENKYLEKRMCADLAEVFMRIKTGFQNAASNRIGANASMIGAKAAATNAVTNQTNAYINAKQVDANCRLIAEQIITNIVTRDGIKLDNVQKSKSMDYVVGRLKEEYNTLRNQNAFENDFYSDTYNTNGLGYSIGSFYNAIQKIFKDFNFMGKK
ncbi:DNA pilot protein [Microvirus sp.]|nr:DNA pilot protein [Microvirus sp.]